MSKKCNIRLRRLALWVLACLTAVCLLPGRAEAGGIATDTLTVKVGYYGMDSSQYVEAGTYHWTELQENLTMYYEAYTFFRPTGEGDYRVVVDSAYGIHIDELLEYTRINLNDVLSVQFYTRDQDVGAFTSFTKSELFRPRYYFEDLPAHLMPVYDEKGRITGYQEREAWSYAVQVQPMLALEDSWITYEVGTEHVQPDYSSMGTANRFRLLFGQVEPTESRTNQSAKYTHTVFVTLEGSPRIVESIGALDGTIGSHTASLTVSVTDPNLLAHLMELLEFTSSDGSVLRIDGWTVTPDSRYGDLATIQISYTVLGPGTATISGNIGGAALDVSAEVTAEEPDQPDQPENPTDPEKPGDGGKPSAGGTDPTTPGGSQSGGQTGGQSGGQTGGQTGPQGGTTISDSNQRVLEEWAAQTGGITGEPSDGARVLYPLTGEMAAALENSGSSAETPGENDPGADSSPTVKRNDQRMLLLMTGLGALLVAAMGGGAGVLYFKKERDE